MKTAMQELLTYILVDCRNESGTIQFNAHETFNKFLEKEKEQIMDSYLQGSFDDGPNITNSEQYYNQTYNQNELPKTYINGVEVDSNNSSVTTTGEGK